MKKNCFIFLMCIVLLASVTCHAASYTLPEKMHNQLAIGSGLKGTFSITAEGEKAETPFLTAVSDAEYSLRGISSGKDYHYSVFQTDASENQTAKSEVYCKDGILYFRSDMVPGKVLALPSAVDWIDSLFPIKGENPTISSFIVNMMSLSETEMNDKWKPVLTKYQNELELWLADFTVQADVIKMDNGSSALDFTYVIPAEEIKKQTLQLFREFTTDQEVLSLLDEVMTPEQRSLYFNADLLYYYDETLNYLDISDDIRMNKRVSAMGEVLSASITVPLDPAVTSYRTMKIESSDGKTVYTLQNEDQLIVIGVPDEKENALAESQKSIWFTGLVPSIDKKEDGQADFLSLRMDIQYSGKSYDDEEEKSHQEDHYTITVSSDETYLPEDFDRSRLVAFSDIRIELDLHYSSKYSQNSATSLDINATAVQEDSTIKVEGKLKTAAPWLFMPFELIDPISLETDHPETLLSYSLDWISNAKSMIHHTDLPAAEDNPEQNAAAGTAGDGMDTDDDHANAADVENTEDTEPIAVNDGAPGAEGVPET